MARQKMEKSNPLPDTSGHTVDTNQLEKVYGAMSPEERDRFTQKIKANTLFRMNLKKS